MSDLEKMGLNIIQNMNYTNLTMEESKNVLFIIKELQGKITKHVDKLNNDRSRDY